MRKGHWWNLWNLRRAKPRVVLRLSGQACEVLPLFALYCRQRGDISIAKVK